MLPKVVKDLGSFVSDTSVNLDFNKYPGAASLSLSDSSPLFRAVRKFHWANQVAGVDLPAMSMIQKLIQVNQVSAVGAQH